MNASRPVQELWQDYLFLTKETAKFLAAGNAEMVAVLLEQRDQLQQLIDRHGDKTFPSSPAGRKMLSAIREENAAISLRMNAFLHKEQRRQVLESAYGGTAAPAGGLMNRRG